MARVPFQRRNTETLKRKNVGRPKRMTATLAEVCSEEELKALVRLTFERAMAGEATSLCWVLSQMPKMDSGFRLPPGLPKLDSLANIVDGIAAVSELARLGELNVADADRSLSLLNAIAFSRISLLAKSAERLDAELKELADREAKQQTEAERRQLALN